MQWYMHRPGLGGDIKVCELSCAQICPESSGFNMGSFAEIKPPDRHLEFIVALDASSPAVPELFNEVDVVPDMAEIDSGKYEVGLTTVLAVDRGVVQEKMVLKYRFTRAAKQPSADKLQCQLMIEEVVSHTGSFWSWQRPLARMQSRNSESVQA